MKSGVIMNKLSLKKKGPMHFRRLRMAENLISAYVGLSEDDKAYVEHFLALSGLALASCQLIPTTDHRWGFPCCVWSTFSYMPSPIPRQH